MCANFTPLKSIAQLCLGLSLLFLITSLRAGDLDTIGDTLLIQVDPTLQGAGILVAQPEALLTQGSNDFEVNPFVVGQPTNLFTWISASGTATTFPNSVGSESDHADSVGYVFYSPSGGVAPQVSHVDNQDADYFIAHYIQTGLSFPALVVNQSFSEGTNDTTTDQEYDNYAANKGVLFLSGILTFNGVRICSPASCYNGIAVGVITPGGTLGNGPTTDGRSKPDITSPGSGATSFATPYVSGAAAVLLQAALRGDGGPNTNAAKNIRTIKALLLNGAVKPLGWTNGVISPLDARWGAGILNVFNSWEQLKGGKTTFIESTSVMDGSPHPPGANPSNEPVLRGWDFNSLTNADSSHDQICHYYFNLTGSNTYTLTTTLVWLRQNGKANINNLNLFLYNTANSNLVLSSTSTIDNVQHIYIPSLPAGRYDLQVEKDPTGEVTANETYALAFEFFNLPLAITQVDTNAVISWPLVPTGFQLQSTTNLTPPGVWSAVAAPVTVNTNTSQNIVTVPINGGNLFFRLQRPTSSTTGS
jgi:hypothetical protein